MTTDETGMAQGVVQLGKEELRRALGSIGAQIERTGTTVLVRDMASDGRVCFSLIPGVPEGLAVDPATVPHYANGHKR